MMYKKLGKKDKSQVTDNIYFKQELEFTFLTILARGDIREIHREAKRQM